MNGKAILWSSWLAGIYCWCWRRVGCLLLVSYQDMGGSCSSDLSCYQTDRYESSSLQGSADTSPGLQPCVLMPVISEWTRRGYWESLPLPLIDYWPASAGSSVVVQFVCIRRGTPLQIVCNVWMWAVQRRQTRWVRCVFRFADVAPNALLEESLVIHGRPEEGSLPHYSHRSRSSHFQLGAFIKSCLLSTNTNDLWKTNYEEYVVLEIVTTLGSVRCLVLG